MSSDGQKGNPYAYVMEQGQGNKGINLHNYRWRPDWRLPPGVKQGKVFLQLAAILGLAAIPVWGLPALRGSQEAAPPKKESVYVTMKKQAKEERKKWIESDEMPYK